MKRAISAWAFSTLAAVALGAAEVGQPAPDFTASDIYSKTVHLSDYKGKIVVLESYNQDCPFCHNHYQTGAMQDLQHDLSSKGIVWLLVDSVNRKNASYRTPEQARKDVTAEKMTVTDWIDDNSGQVGKAYGMRTTPHMFIVDKNGILVYDGAIDDRPAPFGDPRSAHNYVRAGIDQLLAGQKISVPQTKPYGCAVKYGG